MLPVALTCPLWWVARWTARMLASLAVVVAFSLGAASLPLGTMVPGGADPGPVVAATAATKSTVAAESTVAADAAVVLRPADAPPPAGAGHPSVTAPAPQRVPTGHTPAAAGPRAPPVA
ncbi:MULTISPECIES: hypothetical protein [unclassified Micromonospora]|uniref:hypothetical protein n=1 Tax=unclassified Micromonospora TaxID=2617518 RepID=UPI00362599B3